MRRCLVYDIYDWFIYLYSTFVNLLCQTSFDLPFCMIVFCFEGMLACLKRQQGTALGSLRSRNPLQDAWRFQEFQGEKGHLGSKSLIHPRC